MVAMSDLEMAKFKEKFQLEDKSPQINPKGYSLYARERESHLGFECVLLKLE